jgi:hypothetical protein
MEYFIDNCPLSKKRYQRDQKGTVVSGAQHQVYCAKFVIDNNAIIKYEIA